MRIKPDKHEAFYNWGTTLSDWAKQKQGDEADRLFREAAEKYAEAVRIKPDKHEAFYNWGTALLDWAKQKQGDEADRLFREAAEKYAEAVRIKPDSPPAHYNLACLAALRKDVAACLSSLQQWVRFNPTPQRSELAKDSDFDSVRDDPQFISFMVQLPK